VGWSELIIWQLTSGAKCPKDGKQDVWYRILDGELCGASQGNAFSGFVEGSKEHSLMCRRRATYANIVLLTKNRNRKGRVQREFQSMHDAVDSIFDQRKAIPCLGGPIASCFKLSNMA